MPKPLTIDPIDFANLYLTDYEYKKSARRTREWTIPHLKQLGITCGRVLSIGCANGIDVVEMRAAGYDAYGMDLYPPCQQAAAWCKQARANAIPFETEYFDAAIMLEVIEHIAHSERKKSASECLRILKPGGVLILATPNRLFPLDEHSDKWIRVHSPFSDDTVSVRELEKLFHSKAKILSWKKYFAFEMIRAAKVLQPFMSFLDLPMVHRSPFNPHLFVAIRRPSVGRLYFHPLNNPITDEVTTDDPDMGSLAHPE